MKQGSTPEADLLAHIIAMYRANLVYLAAILCVSSAILTAVASTDVASRQINLKTSTNAKTSMARVAYSLTVERGCAWPTSQVGRVAKAMAGPNHTGNPPRETIGVAEPYAAAPSPVAAKTTDSA